MIRNMNEYDNEKVFKLGLTLFREEDEIPCFKEAIKTYIKELSYVVTESNNVIGFILVCKKMTKIYFLILVIPYTLFLLPIMKNF